MMIPEKLTFLLASHREVLQMRFVPREMQIGEKMTSMFQYRSYFIGYLCLFDVCNYFLSAFFLRLSPKNNQGTVDQQFMH